MLIVQSILTNLTPSSIHKIIQGMDVNLPSYGGKAITIHNIAEQLHVSDEELSPYMSTLQSLNYIRFSDKTNEAIILTLNGKFTIVPQ